MNRMIIIGLLALSNISLLPHPIHIAVIEIRHNAENRTLEVEAKIFADDLQDDIRDQLGIKTDLLNPKHYQRDTSAVRKYLEQFFILELNGEKIKGHYLGFELEGMASWSYIEFTNVKKVKSLSGKANILMRQFDDQKNIVHLSVNEESKTYYLRNRQGYFSYQK